MNKYNTLTASGIFWAIVSAAILITIIAMTGVNYLKGSPDHTCYHTAEDFVTIGGDMEHLVDHELTNRKVKYKDTEDISVIEKVFKAQDPQGGFYILLLTHNEKFPKSHGQLYWENISSKESILLELIEEMRINFKLMEDK